MLYQFSQDNSEKVDATYLVSGIKKQSTTSGGAKRSVVIVKEARLNTVIDDFETVLSKHVYALSSKEPDVDTISKVFATKLWYGDFQQRKNLLNDSGDLGQRFRRNAGSSIKCESCSTYDDSGRTLASVEDTSTGRSSMFGAGSKSKGPQTSVSSDSRKKGKLKKSSVASFFGTKKSSQGKSNNKSKQASLFQKKSVAVASPPRSESASKTSKKSKALVVDDDDDDDDDDIEKDTSTPLVNTQSQSSSNSKKAMLEDDDDDDDEDDVDSTQIHVSNTPTGSVVSSGKSVADSLEVNTSMSPADPVASPAKNSGAEVKQTESPILNKPMDTDDSPTEEPPAMFSSSSASKEDGGKKKKKYKKVLQNKTFQNEQGYFVTESVYVDVTDDEADDDENHRSAPKKMMNLKRKSPSLKSKSKSSMSSGTSHGKAKKKQRSLMGFFSKKK